MINKIPYTLTYRRHGTQPPLFVAGTFTEPPWEPQEMSCATGQDGEHTFSKTLVVEPDAEIHYKFRIGKGNWWVLNEDVPTVRDAAGNQNNVFRAPSKKASSSTLEKKAGLNTLTNGEPANHTPSASTTVEKMTSPGGEATARGEGYGADHESTENLLEAIKPNGPSPSRAEQTPDLDGNTSTANMRPGSEVPGRSSPDEPVPVHASGAELKAKRNWIIILLHTFWIEWVGGLIERLLRRGRQD